ncbi:MAG: SoxR reducing system RseC family protein [Halanaerobiales bacterium]|nr:SoxR reducing system RseC family protein [Halanaerobiales bacterium]
MKERARVIKKENDQSLVQIIRTSACSHCDEKCMLADDSHEVEEMEVLVNDPIGAEVGSTVELEMGARPILFSALVVYLLPLVAIIAGYFAGSSWFSGIINNSEVAGIIGSGIGFLLSFAFLRIFDKKAGSKSYFHPEISRVVAHNGFYYES